MKTFIVHENSFRKVVFPENISAYETDDDPRPVGIPVDFFGMFSVKVPAQTEQDAIDEGILLINAAKHNLGHHLVTTFDKTKYNDMLEITQVPCSPKRGQLDLFDET